MYQLSGTIRRILGRKVLDLNGNAVLGFKQNFDLEEDEKSIVCRAIGTAVKLSRVDAPVPNSVPTSIPATPSAVIAKDSTVFMSPAMLPAVFDRKPSMNADDDLSEEEYELADLPQAVMHISTSTRLPDPVLLTLLRYPEHAIIGTGGFVCAASIKVLDNDSKDVRESWWNEAREEIKAHAKTLNCSHVIGYTEQESIVDEVAFLYCSGTAVNVDVNAIQFVNLRDDHQKSSVSSLTSPKSPIERSVDDAQSNSSPSKIKKKKSSTLYSP
jgi:uncharacterized protein YbjQ (UPF0145 family)